ncbi:MAG: lauroyl acyltransferase [Cypionkella sp.]|uniref:lysophospholipid acyltransferase family protein n=1 Tax=Cypionkella sp. TaxID=2811411 RepID=UPI0026370123|nr:lysophospholipid acyltransferase family protein [Cypionkella sp.]MDB5660657.1 lauroyl acyltransferase [Cypionkella sp.]
MSDTPFQPLDFAQNLVVRGLIRVGLLLPYRWRVPLLGAILRGPIGWIAGYRRRAELNLKRIWPEMSLSQRRSIASQSLDNAGRTLIENYSTADFLARQSHIVPHGPGVEALAKAQAEGRAVILVSGHFGNYEAARACLVARGYTIGGLYRPMSNSYFNAHYVQTMQAFGGPIFPQGRAGTTGFVKHLKAGGLLVLLFDQRAGRDQIEFLGEPARTALSAAELALRYKADLIPFYATRQADGVSFTVDLEAPIPHSTPLQMTTELTRSLEARVKANPGQWFWIHRRWR